MVALRVIALPPPPWQDPVWVATWTFGPIIALFAAILLVVAYRRQRAKFRSRVISEGVATDAAPGDGGFAR